MDDRRLLLVHAHPDDEAISTGATMISYARRSATVVLVTCTRGELGGPGLAGLHDGDPDGLALHREAELAEAFVRADPDDAVRAMVEILRAERPQVVVTYDANGGYGHPDHIQANRVTMAALDPAADPRFRAGARRAVAGGEGLLEHLVPQHDPDCGGRRCVVLRG